MTNFKLLWRWRHDTFTHVILADYPTLYMAQRALAIARADDSVTEAWIEVTE